MWSINFVKYASPKNRIAQFKITDPWLRFFIFKYENIVPWGNLQGGDQNSLAQCIQTTLIPSLIAKTDPKSEHNYFLKDIDLEDEFRNAANMDDPDIQQARSIYKTDPEKAKKSILEALNKNKKDNFSTWTDYVSEQYKESPGFVYCILHPVIESSTDADTLPCMNIDANIVAQVFEKVQNQPNTEPFDVLKAYRKAQDAYVPRIIGEAGEDGWIKLNSKKNDPKNFENNMKRLMDYGTDARWCVGGRNFAERYLSKGNFYIYVEKGRAKAAVRMDEDKVAEIRGVANQPEKLWNYAWQVEELFDKEGLPKDGPFTELSQVKELNERFGTDPVYQRKILSQIERDPSLYGKLKPEYRKLGLAQAMKGYANSYIQGNMNEYFLEDVPVEIRDNPQFVNFITGKIEEKLTYRESLFDVKKTVDIIRNLIKLPDNYQQALWHKPQFRSAIAAEMLENARTDIAGAYKCLDCLPEAWRTSFNNDPQFVQNFQMSQQKMIGQFIATGFNYQTFEQIVPQEEVKGRGRRRSYFHNSRDEKLSSLPDEMLAALAQRTDFIDRCVQGLMTVPKESIQSLIKELPADIAGSLNRSPRFALLRQKASQYLVQQLNDWETQTGKFAPLHEKDDTSYDEYVDKWNYDSRVLKAKELVQQSETPLITPEVKRQVQARFLPFFAQHIQEHPREYIPEDEEDDNEVVPGAWNHKRQSWTAFDKALPKSYAKALLPAAIQGWIKAFNTPVDAHGQVLSTEGTFYWGAIPQVIKQVPEIEKMATEQFYQALQGHPTIWKNLPLEFKSRPEFQELLQQKLVQMISEDPSHTIRSLPKEIEKSVPAYKALRAKLLSIAAVAPTIAVEELEKRDGEFNLTFAYIQTYTPSLYAQLLKDREIIEAKQRIRQAWSAAINRPEYFFAKPSSMTADPEMRKQILKKQRTSWLNRVRSDPASWETVPVQLRKGKQFQDLYNIYVQPFFLSQIRTVEGMNKYFHIMPDGVKKHPEFNNIINTDFAENLSQYIVEHADEDMANGHIRVDPVKLHTPEDHRFQILRFNNAVQDAAIRVWLRRFQAHPEILASLCEDCRRNSFAVYRDDTIHQVCQKSLQPVQPEQATPAPEQPPVPNPNAVAMNWYKALKLAAQNQKKLH